jgi:hypothetical protein
MVPRNTASYIDSHLLEIIERLYKPCGFSASFVTEEAEGAAYGASTFHLNQYQIKFRIAKITPTKIGQFVTLWKRNSAGVTCPFDHSDLIDIVVISTRYKNLFGQFVFPRNVLIEKGIISTKTREGKRGFRVYPPWDKAANKQALKTQNWQLNYFLAISEKGSVDYARAQSLYSLGNPCLK